MLRPRSSHRRKNQDLKLHGAGLSTDYKYTIEAYYLKQSKYKILCNMGSFDELNDYLVISIGVSLYSFICIKLNINIYVKI